MEELIYDVYVDGAITETTSNKDYAIKLYVYYAAKVGRMVEVRERTASNHDARADDYEGGCRE